MEIVVFVLWLGLAIGVGMMSATKTLGFWGGFLISILLSPLIGFIVYAVSMDKADKIRMIEQQHAAFNTRFQNTQAQSGIAANGSTADEIAKLVALRDSGAISQEEFESQKKKLLNV